MYLFPALGSLPERPSLDVDPKVHHQRAIQNFPRAVLAEDLAEDILDNFHLLSVISFRDALMAWGIN